MPTATCPRSVRSAHTSDWPRHLAAWGALSIVFGIGLGLTVTALGSHATGELALDRRIAADRFVPLVDVARAVDLLIGPPLAATLLAVICLALWALQSFRIAIVFGVLTSVGWLSALGGKLIVQRPRPPQSVHPLVLETARDSFPSGHTAFTAAVVAASIATLWLLGRPIRAACWIGAGSIVLVGMTRLVMGAHFLADVVGAPLFAMGAVAVVAGLWPAGKVVGATHR